MSTALLTSTLFAAFIALAASQDALIFFSPAPVASQAGDLSQVLSPSFAGLGIEPSNLFSFTGTNEPNKLSINLLSNLANYTGVPPYIRLGGNTQDYMIWQADYDQYSVGTNRYASGQGAEPSDSLFFGPKYFAALNRLPTGTPVTFGLNLAYEGTSYGGYIPLIVAEADAARTNMKNVHLAAFEIGNEPDLYAQNGFRTGSWGGPVYAQEWHERAQAIWEQVLRPNGERSNFFEPGTTASTIGTSFEIAELEVTPITSGAPGSSEGYVSAWSQHDYYYYIGVSTYALTLDMMMDLSTTVQQFAAWTTQVQEAHRTKYPYVLREMASVGPIGQQGISDVFGATLWTLNFLLYTAGLNVSSVEFHMTDTSFAAPWQPIDNPVFTTGPHVRTTYYAFAAMAQLIGTGCTTQLVGLPITTFPVGYEDRLAIYTTYQNGDLAAIVMLNTLQKNATESKNNVTFTFSLPALSGKILYLSSLTADGADSTTGTTFNGISYELSGDGAPTVVNSHQDSVQIASNGTVSIVVRDTQAVVANVGSVIGLNKPINSSACSALAQVASVEGGEDAQQTHSVAVATPQATSTASGGNAYNVHGQASAATSSPTHNGAFASLSTTPPAVRAGALGVLLGGAVYGLA